VAWAPDYITVAELKPFINITNPADTADDTVLAPAVTAASRSIDKFCNRQFGKVAAAEERLYTAFWDRRRCRWVVAIDDLMTTTNFVAEIQDEDGVTVGIIDEYTLEPRNGAAVSRPWTELVVKPTSATMPTGARDEVAVTAIWGWTSVPVAVQQATYLQASRLFARRRSPFGVAGSPDMGSELRLLAKLDPDVAVSLGPYVRWWAGA